VGPGVRPGGLCRHNYIGVYIFGSCCRGKCLLKVVTDNWEFKNYFVIASAAIATAEVTYEIYFNGIIINIIKHFNFGAIR